MAGQLGIPAWVLVSVMRIVRGAAGRGLGVFAAVALAAAGMIGGGSAAHAAPPRPHGLAVSGRPGGVIGAGSRSASAAGGVAGWGKAIEVPGTGRLNVGGNARVTSVSCTPQGYCAAGGTYGAYGAYPVLTQAFVVSRRHGKWGRAVEVPGLAGLGATLSQIGAVSCASPGNCAAGGYYFDVEGDQWAFVVSERDGRWGDALQVAGALNVAGEAAVSSVSCPSAGSCEAAGFYWSGIGDFEAFAVGQRDGTWGSAIQIPGTVTAANHSLANSVSCASAGNCSAGGTEGGQAFVASQRNGQWGNAIEVPGIAAVNLGVNAGVDSVSCSSPGNCAASGYYEASAYTETAKWQAFAVSQRDGTWGTAVAVLRSAVVSDNVVSAAATSVSCPTAGGCSAGGFYTGRRGALQAFVVSQRHGRWGKAIKVPGTSALNRGGGAQVLSVSCSSAGNCTAVGYYTGRRGNQQPFIAAQRNGTWTTAVNVPGAAALNTGESAALLTVSCPPAGGCSAGGAYKDRSGHLQAFVVSQTETRP